jgi:HAD superfamily phosphatase
VKINNYLALVIFDIDGVIRDVSNSYRRAISDTVEHFTDGAWRPTMVDLDNLKSEGIWNNDWEASQELIYRYFELNNRSRETITLDYAEIVDFFQQKYRGKRDRFDGYITTEPLLVSASYLEQLTANKIGWGFFSGATRGSAEYVLKQRLGLASPVLIAMEDAPGKPDPQGLLMTIDKLESLNSKLPVFYLGDTVADMYTIVRAREIQPQRQWIGIGILPPHINRDRTRIESYREKLQQAGAAIVLDNVEELDLEKILSLI